MSDPFERIGDGVYSSGASLVTVSPAAVAFLRERLAEADRRRVRLCAHAGAEAPLQEMLILVAQESYIRPHRHLDKAESLLVLEGAADAVFFEEDGAVRDVLPLGPHGSGRTFYYRIGSPVWHTLLVRTPELLFHEATLGPFRRERTEYAPWAPAEEDAAGAVGYRSALEDAVRRFRSRPGDRGDVR